MPTHGSDSSLSLQLPENHDRRIGDPFFSYPSVNKSAYSYATAPHHLLHLVPIGKPTGSPIFNHPKPNRVTHLTKFHWLNPN